MYCSALVFSTGSCLIDNWPAIVQLFVVSATFGLVLSAIIGVIVLIVRS